MTVTALGIPVTAVALVIARAASRGYSSSG
jgi:hypothetical protein